MVEALKRFIEDNIELINSEEWLELYTLASSNIPFQIGNLTTTLLDSDINPLETLDRIVPEMFCDSRIKQIYIPDNIDIIRRQAFKSCFDLTTISLPETLNRIDATAFSYCYALENIEFRGTIDKLPAMPPDLLQDCATDVIHCTDGDYDVLQGAKVTT